MFYCIQKFSNLAFPRGAHGPVVGDFIRPNEGSIVTCACWTTQLEDRGTAAIVEIEHDRAAVEG